MLKQLTPKQAAIADMRSCGLDTSVLRRTVVVVEEEVHFDGRIFNGITQKNAERLLARKITRTITEEIISYDSL